MIRQDDDGIGELKRDNRAGIQMYYRETNQVYHFLL